MKTQKILGQMNTQNKTGLPASFFLFVGDNYSDSENWNSRYGKASSGAEYGMSWDEFVNECYEDAVLDGQDSFEQLDHASQKANLQSFVDASRRSIENVLKNIDQVESFLFEKDKQIEPFDSFEDFFEQVEKLPGYVAELEELAQKPSHQDNENH